MCRNSIVVASLTTIMLISVASVANAKPPQPSAIECDMYARNYARDDSRQGQILGGTAFGSLGGFALGSIWAASGVGAAIGAGVGLIGGLIVRASDADKIYQAAYQDCMTGRVR